MTALLLAAGGGLAREVLEVLGLLAADDATTRPDVIGIVDDDASRRGARIAGVSVIGGLDVVHDFPDSAVLLCAGRGATRERMAARLGLPDHRYAHAIHPSVTVPASCTLGAGSIVLAGSVLTADVTIGRHVVVMPNVTLTHDDTVGDFATLCAAVTLGGDVHVGTGAYLGMSASVREHVRIGADAVVGMGAVVLADVPAGETWVGVPARPSLLREFDLNYDATRAAIT